VDRETRSVEERRDSRPSLDRRGAKDRTKVEHLREYPLPDLLSGEVRPRDREISLNLRSARLECLRLVREVVRQFDEPGDLAVELRELLSRSGETATSRKRSALGVRNHARLLWRPEKLGCRQ